MSLVCCCALEGTHHCRTCKNFIDYFGNTGPYYPYKTYPTPPSVTPPQQGWICPKCNKVNAPFMPYCDCNKLSTNDKEVK